MTSTRQKGAILRGGQAYWPLAAIFTILLQGLPELRGQGISSKADASSENLEIHADLTDFDQATGMARAAGDVIVKFGPVTIYADEAEFSRGSGIIRASGKVRLYRGEQVFNAEELFYNVNSGEVTASQLKSAIAPFFYQSDRIVIPREAGCPIEMDNALITTHDAENPQFSVTARRLTIYPDDRVAMRGGRIRVGETNIFGFPYYVQPVRGELGYMATPGWSSAWGGYVLNRYGFNITDDYLAHAHLDYRSERGLAGGVEVWDQNFDNNPNIGRLKLYAASDDRPERRFNGTVGPAGVPTNRYRINLQHRVYFPSDDNETFYFDFDVNKLSDAFIYQDFFPKEYRDDPKPDNVVALTRLFKQGEATLVGRYDLNDFFHTDTRTEGALDVIRTPLIGDKLFYQSYTSFGALDEKTGIDTIPGSFSGPLTPYTRFTTYHELLSPQTVDGWLNVVPRAGVGYFNYSGFDLPGLDTFDRPLFHAGLDLSFKMSRKNRDIFYRPLGIDGLMHVVQPYLNYSVTETEDIRGRFNAIDGNVRSTRPRPIDLPLLTSIDSLADKHAVRAGVSNRWYTQRDGATVEWLSMTSFVEGYVKDPEFGRRYSNIFSDIQWNPVPWMGFSATSQLPFLDSQMNFTELQLQSHWMPSDWFRASVGYYYLNDHPLFNDADLITLDTYTRLGDEWGFSSSHRFSADDGVLEFQQYALHKDLGAWVARVGSTIRDNRITDKEYGVFLSLTLKAFPRISLPVDYVPGIGNDF